MTSESVRSWLDDTSWVDVHRGFLDPAVAGELYQALAAGLPWRGSRNYRYDHWVEENRLSCSWRPDRPAPHPALVEVHRRVRQVTGKPFDGPAFNWYRDGNDGQGFHRDRDMRWCEDTVVAILTLGARRPWLLRPHRRRASVGFDDLAAPPGIGYQGATHDLAPASGDLIVMGGRCQADWQHCVPPVRRPVGGRISVQWRWTSRTGRPEVGPSYRAPRFYAR